MVWVLLYSFFNVNFVQKIKPEAVLQCVFINTEKKETLSCLRYFKPQMTLTDHPFYIIVFWAQTSS